MELRTLAEQIQYLPATEEPLSADIGIVHGKTFDWIFDVGRSQDAFETIQNCQKKKCVVLSHFHGDHTDNISRITYESMYCSAYTGRKLSAGTIVTTTISFEDNVKISLFLLPSLHSKGSLGMEVNNEYAFLGDAVYGTNKNGKLVYNTTVLKELIAALEALKASRVMISHRRLYLYQKADILEELKQIYNSRTPGSAFITIPE